MKRFAPPLAALILAALPVPAPAQDAGADVEEGFSLVEEGARIILRSMLEELAPRLDGLKEDLGQMVEEMRPALDELARMIGDIRNYHAPEMLPNGDIILRRKTPQEVLPGPEPDPETGEIEI
ncbi:hypothetical protein [Albidovulum sp.]